MATYWVYQCSGARTTEAVELTSRAIPSCDGSSGSWVQIEVAATPTSMPDFDAVRAASAFGAGFGLLATGLILVAGMRLIVRAVKEF